MAPLCCGGVGGGDSWRGDGCRPSPPLVRECSVNLRVFCYTCTKRGQIPPQPGLSLLPLVFKPLKWRHGYGVSTRG